MWTLLLLVNGLSSIHTLTNPPLYTANGAVQYVEAGVQHSCASVDYFEVNAYGKLVVVRAGVCK